MMLKLIQTFIIICVLGTSASRNSLIEIKKILKEIIARDAEKSRETHHYEHKIQKDKDLLNSDDYPTLNVYFEMNDKQRDQLKRFDERETEKTCTSGRCGCTGTRCGTPKNKLADNFDRILLELQRQIYLEKKYAKESDLSKYMNNKQYKERASEWNENDDRYDYSEGIVDSKDIENYDSGFQDMTRDDYFIPYDDRLKQDVMQSYWPQAQPPDVRLNGFSPQWYVNEIPLYTNSVPRSQNRVLPLTNRQRGRLLNKLRVEPLQRLIGRRKSNTNAQLGVPFEMDVQGLGQLNPY
ncbi:unnamed protein product, partial [Brenthis ino]